MLMPRKPVPPLSLPTVGGGRFDLGAETARRGTLLCFYRGYHCPACAIYLAELEARTPDFAERGVATVAISADGAERARLMAEKVGASALRVAHDLPLAEARGWGLYVSTSRGVTSIGIEEPALFCEPGLFLVRPDGALYYAAVQTMPFARPHFPELLSALDFTIRTDYPARGAHEGEV